MSRTIQRPATEDLYTENEVARELADRTRYEGPIPGAEDFSVHYAMQNVDVRSPEASFERGLLQNIAQAVHDKLKLTEEAHISLADVVTRPEYIGITPKQFFQETTRSQLSIKVANQGSDLVITRPQDGRIDIRYVYIGTTGPSQVLQPGHQLRLNRNSRDLVLGIEVPGTKQKDQKENDYILMAIKTQN